MVHSNRQSPEVPPPPPPPPPTHDASADIAYAVHSLNDPNLRVVTPEPHPNPTADIDWSFPDTQPGILAAIAAGADTIWANTPLFAHHPLTTTSLPPSTKLIANPPKVVDLVDDKAFTNKLLQHHGFSIPKSWLLEGDSKRSIERLSQLIYDLPYPVIVKPTRGRGSEGVKLIDGFVSMLDTLDELFETHNVVLIEEFLEGEEGTVTVVPDGQGKFIALPIVQRFDQVSGLMPWNGHVPVTKNSRVLSVSKEDSWHRSAKTECEKAVELLKLTSVTRIDIRRKGEDGGKFYLFDVNPKPNLTGAGRPGRDDQDSLCAIAAREFGWEYASLVRKCIETAYPLEEACAIEPPEAVVGSLDNFTQCLPPTPLTPGYTAYPSTAQSERSPGSDNAQSGAFGMMVCH
ncbi:glutathione synthetase ATP-binding domain-like protein [Tuber magnatum]|uniref:Glutathione synthetase ATP-binding domain-like protein n=1 Tax=Tuber magnatum TaxID=42249 RepID=A0A317SS95_9PEZI|nr:glutathione synthetase ATP-binding domain-like protein [Tuber magnatum]